MQTTHFISKADWQALSRFIAGRPTLCAALKIGDNPNTCRPGWDELIDVLGGQFGIFPERFREVFAAEDARQETTPSSR